MSGAREQARSFTDQLAALRFANVFNPYAEACPDCDNGNAASIRRRNLELVLQAALIRGVESIWIARDLGYRGGRRTGLAMTDEIHLASHAALLGTPPLARATKGPAVAERTASVVWQILRAIDRPIFLWNVFPLHPHEPEEPMSNRCHTRPERNACQPLLAWLVEALRPKHIVAIGRDAHAALDDLGMCAIHVRHPSYGGQADFTSGLARIYGLKACDVGNSLQRHLFA